MSDWPEYLDPNELWVTMDCESVGLYGQTFSCAAVLHDGKDAHELGRFMSHYDMDLASGTKEDREWVMNNVSIHPSSIEVAGFVALCEEFVAWLARVAQSYPEKRINIAADVAWPVEAQFLLACVDAFRRRKVNAPYPLHDVSNWMAAAGMSPLENYPRYEGEEPKHEALADSKQSARLLTEALHTLRTLHLHSKRLVRSGDPGSEGPIEGDFGLG